VTDNGCVLIEGCMEEGVNDEGSDAGVTSQGEARCFVRVNNFGGTQSAQLLQGASAVTCLKQQGQR